MKLTYIKTADGMYKCPHCPFTSGPQSTMHYHMKREHCEGELKFKCKHCQKKFVQQSLLDLHMNSWHPQEVAKREKKNVFCCPHPECNVQDLRKGNIISHFCRIHLKDLVDKALKPSSDGCAISCSCCNQTFKSKPSFNYHVFRCVKPSEDHAIYKYWNELSTLEAQSV